MKGGYNHKVFAHVSDDWSTIPFHAQCNQLHWSVSQAKVKQNNQSTGFTIETFWFLSCSSFACSPSKLLLSCAHVVFQCVTNSRSLPYATLNVVKDHCEMSEWLRSSIHPLAPFYVSSYNYTKLAVDRVQAADQRTYNVLLLATGRSRQCGWMAWKKSGTFFCTFFLIVVTGSASRDNYC